MSKGGGSDGGSTTGSITCVEGQDYVGDSTLAGTAAALLGAVACIDVAAVAYRATLSAAIAGTSLSTNNLYGPFEAGFSSSVPGMSCLGSNTVQGGLDTMTSGMIVHNLCNDNTIEVLGVCGDHAVRCAPVNLALALLFSLLSFVCSHPATSTSSWSRTRAA
jgi:hypothetical protein